MSLAPVLPVALLLVLAAVIVGSRAQALSAVLARARRRAALLRWVATTLALLLVVVAAARPSVAAPAPPQSDPRADVNVFFVVDRSVDSRVEDFGGASRMSGIRSDMSAIVDAYPNARFATIGFSSTAAVDWPLSDDVWSLTAVLAGLSPYVNVGPEAAATVNAGAAANLLRYQLIQATAQYPRAQNLVFYFGEGAGGSTAPQSSFTADDRISGGAVYGYGTGSGGPIPGAYVDGAVTYLADTRTGAPVISGLDEAGLRRVASELAVPYTHREPGQPIATLPDVRPGPGIPPARERIELYWLFALLAALLLLPEIYLTVREFRRNRMSGRAEP